MVVSIISCIIVGVIGLAVGFVIGSAFTKLSLIAEEREDQD